MKIPAHTFSFFSARREGGRRHFAESGIFRNFAEMWFKKFFTGYKEEYKSLLRLGAPVLVAQIGIIVVSFADTMMVGDYGTRELAAAAFVNNFFMVPVVMLIGFASGVTPLVGALFGRKDNFGTGRMLRASLCVNIVMALLLVWCAWKIIFL